MAPAKRIVAPHRFLPRRRSLGQELRIIANRSSQPGTGSKLSPIRHRKRPASVDNSQLDKCIRNLDTLCSSPRKAPRLARQKAKANRSYSVPIKTSSPLPKTTIDHELRNQHFSTIEQNVSDFIIQASSPRAINSPDSLTRSEMIAVQQALLQVPGLEGHGTRRAHRVNAPMPKTSSRSARHNALNPSLTVRLSLSPTAIKDQTLNTLFALQQAGYSVASPTVITTSPTDPVVSGPSTPGTFSSGTKSPVTPQNVQATTQFFPVFGHYLPTGNTAQGYYVQQVNPQAAFPQYESPVGPFYPTSLQNRQFHQIGGTSGNHLGQYHPSYDGLLQAGSYVGSLTPNNLSPVLPTQNNQLLYQIPVINTTHEYPYITASNSPLYTQNIGDQTAWNCTNRVASPDQPANGYNQTTRLKPHFGQSVDIYQRLQTNGTSVSPSQLGQFVYQTPGVTLAMNNSGVLYPVNSGYQANCDGLKVAPQPGALHSPKISNPEQGLPFILSGVGPPPRKKMATSLVSQTTERPRSNPSDSQWFSSVPQWQRNFH